MHILLLMTQDLDSPAGAGRYFPLARALVGRGHQVTLAGLHPDFASLKETRFERDGVQIIYAGQMHVRKQDNHKTYFPVHQLLWIVLQATWNLSRIALAAPADVIMVGKPQPMNGLAGWIASRRRGLPLVVDCDDLEAANNRFGAGWQRKIVAWFERRLPRQAQQVTTHNRELEAYLRSWGVPAERITYLPNGVDRQRFAGVPEDEIEALRRKLDLSGRRVVAYIGTLSLPNHPVHLLVEAFARVHRALPHSALLIVGGGEQFGPLHEQARRLGLSDQVRFAGRVAAAEIPPYYRLADVLVDPVEDDPVGRTRLPLKLFEAWVSAAPFVTAEVGDRRRILGEPPAGVLVKPGDSEALSEAILAVLQTPELAKTLRQRGLERCPQYEWTTLAVNAEQACLAALARRSQP